MNNSASFIVQVIPVILVLLVYFVRLESRLTKITTDLCWVKKQLRRREVDKRENEDIDAD